LYGRKGIQPVKNWVVGCWHGYLPRARCRLAYGPVDATVSCFSKIQIGFTSLVPAYLGSSKIRAVKCACVCVVMVCFVADCCVSGLIIYEAAADAAVQVPLQGGLRAV